VSALAFNPDGSILASGGADRKVRLWDLERPDNLPVILDGPERWILSLAFSPDGETLAAGDGNKSIYLWPVRSERIADIICEHVSRTDRNLTVEEWATYIGSAIPKQETCNGQ